MEEYLVSSAWLILKQSRTMEIFREMFWSWLAQEVEKRPLFKKLVEIWKTPGGLLDFKSRALQAKGSRNRFFF